MPRGTCTPRGQCQGCPVWSSVACALPAGGLESSCHQTALLPCCAWSLKTQHNINPTMPQDRGARCFAMPGGRQPRGAGIIVSPNRTAPVLCLVAENPTQHHSTTPPNPRTPRVGPTPQESTLHRHRHTPNAVLIGASRQNSATLSRWSGCLGHQPHHIDDAAARRRQQGWAVKPL